MNSYKANASVIYTDDEGRQIDTFVIFDTDLSTGLTHINYQNLRVSTDCLVLHPKTVCDSHMPIQDAFSYELIRKLREKYERIDAMRTASKQQPEIYLMPINRQTQTGNTEAA